MILGIEIDGLLNLRMYVGGIAGNNRNTVRLWRSDVSIFCAMCEKKIDDFAVPFFPGY
jgi:hypothetical protein